MNQFRRRESYVVEVSNGEPGHDFTSSVRRTIQLMSAGILMEYLAKIGRPGGLDME